MSGFFRGGLFRFALAAALLLVAGWSVTRIVIAANRHQLPYPSRSAPASAEAVPFGHGLTQQGLFDLVKEGRSRRRFPTAPG